MVCVRNRVRQMFWRTGVLQLACDRFKGESVTLVQGRIAMRSMIRCRAARACMALLLGMALLACSKTPPEQALRDAMAGLQSSIEAGDASAVRDYLADDFIGPDGLDRSGAHRLATLQLMRHNAVGLTIGPLDISLQADHATVAFAAAMTGIEGRFLPQSGQIYAVETGWRLQDDQWLMTSAYWNRQL